MSTRLTFSLKFRNVAENSNRNSFLLLYSALQTVSTRLKRERADRINSYAIKPAKRYFG